MLGHQEEIYPVVLLLIEEGPEVCFDNLVNSFRLSVGLGVEGRGHSGADSCDGEEILAGIRREPGITIGHDISREAMESPYFAGEYSGEVFGGFLVFLQGYEVGHLGESDDNYPQLSAAIQLG